MTVDLHLGVEPAANRQANRIGHRQPCLQGAAGGKPQPFTGLRAEEQLLEVEAVPTVFDHQAKVGAREIDREERIQPGGAAVDGGGGGGLAGAHRGELLHELTKFEVAVEVDREVGVDQLNLAQGGHRVAEQDQPRQAVPDPDTVDRHQWFIRIVVAEDRKVANLERAQQRW